MGSLGILGIMLFSSQFPSEGLTSGDDAGPQGNSSLMGGEQWPQPPFSVPASRVPPPLSPLIRPSLLQSTSSDWSTGVIFRVVSILYILPPDALELDPSISEKGSSTISVLRHMSEGPRTLSVASLWEFLFQSDSSKGTRFERFARRM